MSVPRENAVVRCKTLRILRERNAFELISDARDAFRKTVVDTRQREREKKKEKYTQIEMHPQSFFARVDFCIAKGSREK